VVYRSLVTRRDHPTAEDVFARVKAEMPTISLATVYNCLETLVQCNLIRQVNHERGPTRYCPNLEPHAHFYDEQSGRTVDVALPPKLLSALKAILPAGMNASAIEITFRGKSS
jgi:Fur family peroxide stress response transcriptional regulator